MIHNGGCHCGNLKIRLRLIQVPAEVLRACGCSFCRAHNTRDPNGAVDIRADDWSLAVRPLRPREEFVSVSRCGGYIGAVGDADSGMRAVVNTTCLGDRVLFIREPAPTDQAGEATEDRPARRAINWTSATVHR